MYGRILYLSIFLTILTSLIFVYPLYSNPEENISNITHNFTVTINDTNLTENITASNITNSSILTRINQVILNTFSLIQGQILNIKARLTYENLSPISDQELMFYRNETLIGSNLTNETGWAQLDWISNISGNYTINVSYAGDENFSSSFNDTKKIEISPLEVILPDLINETIESVLLNIQSYQIVEGNLTIEFNTTGTADLIITGVNGTSFAEDLQLELKKGNTTLIDFYYIVEKIDENE